MLNRISRLLGALRRGDRRSEPSVLAPEENPRDEVDVTATTPWGVVPRVTVALTRRRLLLTDNKYTKEILSIPLTAVTALKSTPEGIRIAYQYAPGAEQVVWLRRTTDADDDDVIWMLDEAWLGSVAEVIMQETGRDVRDDKDPPWYKDGA